MLPNAINDTTQEFIKAANLKVALPSTLIVWVSTLLFFLVFGLGFVEGEKSKKVILKLFFLVFIFSGLVVLAVTLLPNFVQWFVRAIASLA